MTDSADGVRELVMELEGKLPRSGGRVQILDSPDEFIVDGDQLGFQRLGVALLRSTLEPTTSVRGIDDALDIAAYDVFDHPKQPPVVFRQVTDWPPETSRGSVGAKLLKLGCAAGAAAILLSILVLVMIGVGTLVGWFHA